MERDLRLFLDSNVILSGLLSSKGAPRSLLDLLCLRVPLLRGFTGQYNLDEIERHLLRRFPELAQIYQDYLPRMNLKIIEVPPYRMIEPLIAKMSPKDTPVLASAQLARADYLVTGDKKGFPAKVAKPIVVVTPNRFLNDILPPLLYKK